MKQDGLTLVEVLVVAAIVSLLATLAGVEYAGWARKYDAENEIKTLYGDMIETRVNAMQKNVQHLMVLSGDRYTVCEDGNLDGVCDAGSTIARLSRSNLKHTLAWALSGGGSRVSFDRRGLSMVNGHININVSETDVDCVTVSATRINVGRMNSGACEPK
jgi:prepilin-type N-terminal cleavage/methylation domain-containing protein